MASLTQAQADLLYAAIIHQHDDLYALINHGHDHGALAGLADDDHTQYFDQTRGDARYLRSVPQQDHGGLAGLGDDDHTQYYNQTRGDARYLRSVPQQAHGGLSGLAGDDHTQYYNQTRGDARYLRSVPDALTFRAHKNGTDQTGASGTLGVNTKLTCTTEEWDIGSCYDAANSKYTPSVAGKYLFGISVYFASMADQVNYGTLIYKNGSAYSYTSLNKASGTGGHGTNGTTLVSMNGSTDYVEAYAFQESGSTKTIAGPAVLTYFYGIRTG